MLEKLFNEFANVFYVNEDVSKTKNGYRIKMLVPGYSKEDLILEYSGNILIVSDKESKRILRKYEIADNFKQIDAKCSKGILEINLTELEETKNIIPIK